MRLNRAAVVMSVLAAALALPLHAQPVLKVTPLQFKGKNNNGIAYDAGQITMPFVQGPDADVAGRINDALFIRQLTALAPRQPKTLTAADGFDAQGMASQSFSVQRNDARLLSIAFEGEGCGAYCEEFRQAHAFDVHTGRQLTATNFFTITGMRAVSARMEKERVARYRQQLVKLTRERKAVGSANTKSNNDTRADIDERLGFNEQCLKERLQTPTAPAAVVDFNAYIYELTRTTLNITAGRCSNHAMRALDDVGDVTLAVPYAQAETWLTPYAQALLNSTSSTSAPAAPENVFGQVLHGSLQATGKSAIPVTMLLDRHNDGSISGTYFYDRVRKAIQISGTSKGNDLTLNEGPATFELKSQPAGLEGRWTSGTQVLQVRLSP